MRADVRRRRAVRRAQHLAGAAVAVSRVPQLCVELRIGRRGDRADDQSKPALGCRRRQPVVFGERVADPQARRSITIRRLLRVETAIGLACLAVAFHESNRWRCACAGDREIRRRCRCRQIGDDAGIIRRRALATGAHCHRNDQRCATHRSNANTSTKKASDGRHSSTMRKPACNAAVLAALRYCS